MSRNYDNWERLVAAVLKKQQLWELFHQNSRSPSVLSEASNLSSTSSSFRDVDFSNPGSSSTSYRQELEDAVLNSRKLFPNKLILVSDFSPAFDVRDVFLDSAKLLGKVAFGSAYEAVMHNGMRIVVKRLNFAYVSISEGEFMRHMDIVGNVKHENVAPLRAYYCSTDEKLVLRDYYGQSVYALLHGHTNYSRANVDWETRLRIAIGAARGIAEIHRQNGGKLIHGNIRSSNIFLNAKQYGCISDVGLAKIIQTTYIPPAGFYAPEIKNTKNVSQESDVFSFGILLLELLTRKYPGDVNLVKLVSSVKSKFRTSSVFDVDLLKHPNIREQMVKVLQIGIRCVAKSVKKRPKMFEVVNMLEDLGRMNSGNSVSAKLVFFENANPTFDLEDMLRASAEVLGKGTFGTSYKATLENGNIIRVKRMKDVNVMLMEFEQHMEVIGRMRHENVADLRAYYYSRDEKIFVYDYQNQDSVSSLIHGKIDGSKIHLDWETRLKIAVGAARGIAHIHKQDNQNLVHGNIKSSNIFLNTQKYGIVSDTVHAKLTSSIKRSLIPTLGHFAPEVKDTRNTTQASDVYSFGVLLLELLSGRLTQHTAKDGEVISLVEWVKSVIRDDGPFVVFDLEILRYHTEGQVMVRVLEVAMDCVDIAPENRPRMSEVVKMLEEISGIEIEPSIESSLDDLVEDTVGQLSFPSRLENLLDDLLPTLVYK